MEGWSFVWEGGKREEGGRGEGSEERREDSQEVLVQQSPPRHLVSPGPCFHRQRQRQRVPSEGEPPGLDLVSLRRFRFWRRQHAWTKWSP